jgi:hypothetical protein
VTRRFTVLLGRDNLTLAEAHAVAAQYRAKVSVIPYNTAWRQCPIAQAILTLQRAFLTRPQ